MPSYDPPEQERENKAAPIMAKFMTRSARHWLLSTLFVLMAITAYTQSPLYGADPTPTPDVSTVPRPGQLFTPTPTPAPVIVIVTQTPVASGTSVVPAPAGTAGAGPRDPAASALPAPPRADQSSPGNSSVAPMGASPTGVILTAQVNVHQSPHPAAPVVDILYANSQVTITGRNAAGDWVAICCGAQRQQAGWINAAFVRITFAGAQTLADLPVVTDTLPLGLDGAQPRLTASALGLTIQALPGHIWPGARLQLQIALSNHGADTLHDLDLRQPLPPPLQYLNSQLAHDGAITVAPTADQGALLTLRWAQLLPGATTTATVTLQVRSDTPNGLFLDNQANVHSREGATATVDFTLVLPPAGLPQFRGNP